MRISDMMDMEDGPEEGGSEVAAPGGLDVAKISATLDQLQAQISELRSLLPASSEEEAPESAESSEEVEESAEEAPDASKEMKKSMAAATLSKHL